jgi:hypothetical protein
MVLEIQRLLQQFRFRQGLELSHLQNPHDVIADDGWLDVVVCVAPEPNAGQPDLLHVDIDTGRARDHRNARPPFTDDIIALAASAVAASFICEFPSCSPAALIGHLKLQ